MFSFSRRIILPLIASLALIAPAAPIRAGVIWIGQQAPELSIEKLLNAPPTQKLDLASYRGRALVIEFFSIHCPKCREAMPHFNALAQQMADEPITFIALSTEDEAEVRQFMTQNPMSAYIGLDTDWSMWRDYSVLGIPLAVVINPSGVIAAAAHPDDLNPAMLREVINGKTPNAPLTELLEDPKAPETQSNKALPFVKVEVRPAQAGARASIWKGVELRARAVTLADLLSESLGVPAHLFVSDDLLLDARYDVTITPPTPDAQMVDDMLRAVLEQMVKPRLREVERPIPTYVLRARSAGAMRLRPGEGATPSLKGSDGHVIAVNVPLSQIVANLQRDLNAPVIDETGLAGGYNFELKWDVNDPDSVIRALRDQLGLDVRYENRPTKVYLVKRGD